VDLTENRTLLARALPAVDDPGATAAQLADATGLGYSTVTRLLRGIADTGLAVKDDTGWHATAQWHATPGVRTPPVAAPDTDDTGVAETDPHLQPQVDGDDRADAGPQVTTGKQRVLTATVPTDTANQHTVETPSDGEETPQPGRSSAGDDRQRLRKGELPKQILAALREHPNEALGPHQLSKLVNARSAGAVANACDRLVADGLATLTNERPRRYQVTTTT
jgi:hypothetical protein